METQNNMTPNTPPTDGTPAGATTETAPESNSQSMPLIGAVVIVALLVAGGFYYWSQNMDNTSDDGAQSAEEISNEKDGALEALQEQSTSNAYSAIEADVKATDLNFGDLDSAGNELGL